MASLEERVALLEGRVQEQADYMKELRVNGAEIRHALTELRADMNARFADMDRRFDRVERHFAWLIGIVVTSFVGTIGTVAGAFWSLVRIIR